MPTLLRHNKRNKQTIQNINKKEKKRKLNDTEYSIPIHFTKTASNNERVSTLGCKDNKCKCCPHMTYARDIFTSSNTNQSFMVIKKTPAKLDCKSSNIIHLITCTKCGVQYIGHTTEQLNSRLNRYRNQGEKHMNKLSNKTSNPLVINHFYNDQSLCKQEDMLIQPIEQITINMTQINHLNSLYTTACNLSTPFETITHINQFLEQLTYTKLKLEPTFKQQFPTEGKDKIGGTQIPSFQTVLNRYVKFKLRVKEDFWISRLRTHYPVGLNAKFEFEQLTIDTPISSRFENYVKIET